MALFQIALIGLVLALPGCAPVPQRYSLVPPYGPGYAPAYPPYELHNGEVSICK